MTHFRDFGVQPYLFPMPTYMIATYNEDDTVDAMAMAWGGICAENMVALNLEADHKTVDNLKARGAFTLSVPGVDTLVECDYMGTAGWTLPWYWNGPSPWNAGWRRSRSSPTASVSWARS